jgi:hypothetical protein
MKQENIQSDPCLLPQYKENIRLKAVLYVSHRYYKTKQIHCLDTNLKILFQVIQK